MLVKPTVRLAYSRRENRLLVHVLLLAMSCSTSVLHASDPALPVFKDVTHDAGITAKHGFGDDRLTNIVEGTGAGAMFFDYDSDGWLDVYLLSGCYLPEVNDNRGRKYRGKLTNHLYRNSRDGTFTDVTDQAGVADRGYGAGCSAADFDNDGDLDLYVLNYGKNVLYRNDGNGTFTDISEQSGLDDAKWSLSAPWFDYDGDGDLDVYVVNYLEFDPDFREYYAPDGYPGPRSYGGQQDALYRNNGNGTFTDVTEAAGLINPDGRGMSGTVADLNNDGLLDLYVTNDAMENYFYRNTGDGTFVEDGLIMGLAFGEGGQNVSSMGPAVGDVDRDGWLDIYIPDMGYGCLLLNRKDYFEDRTAPSKLAVFCGQYVGWGGVLFDYDNNGYLDLFVANGDAHREYAQEDVLMRNDGKGDFKDVAIGSGDYFRQKYVGRGTTSGDYDNDGDIDLLVVNLNDTPRLLRNDGGNKNNWLTVAVKLPGGKSDAVGARVAVKTDTLTQIHDVMPVTGYLSQADPRAHFGLGDAEKAQVDIRWPDGRTSTLKDVSAKQILMVEQDAK